MADYEINAKDSPPSFRVRIVGAEPVSESNCHIKVIKTDGTEVIAKRAVTGTVVYNSNNYFDVKLTLNECDLLVPGEYIYIIQVESSGLNFRQETVYSIRVREDYIA